jgi:hypothetical protein
MRSQPWRHPRIRFYFTYTILHVHTISGISIGNNVTTNNSAGSTFNDDGGTNDTERCSSQHRSTQIETSETLSSNHNSKFSSLGINIEKPRYPNYASLPVRISSYQGWPSYLDPSLKVDPAELFVVTLLPIDIPCWLLPTLGSPGILYWPDECVAVAFCPLLFCIPLDGEKYLKTYLGYVYFPILHRSLSPCLTKCYESHL